MNTDYIFLCGVMWCRFGEQDPRQGANEGCRFYGSGHERTCLGDVGERCESLDGVWKNGHSLRPANSQLFRDSVRV